MKKITLTEQIDILEKIVSSLQKAHIEIMTDKDSGYNNFYPSLCYYIKRNEQCPDITSTYPSTFNYFKDTRPRFYQIYRLIKHRLCFAYVVMEIIHSINLMIFKRSSIIVGFYWWTAGNYDNRIKYLTYLIKRANKEIDKLRKQRNLAREFFKRQGA